VIISSCLRFGILAILASHALLPNSECHGQEPRIAGIGPTVSASIGYAYLNSEIPCAGRISQNGVASGVTVDFTRRFGIKTETSYTRTYGAFGVNHHSDVLAYLGGPDLYPVRRQRFGIYAQGLIGAARMTGVIPEGNGAYLQARVHRLAWSLGGGEETKLSRSTVLRIGADYLRGSYFSPDRVLRGQGNIRVITSLVYTFGKYR